MAKKAGKAGLMTARPRRGGKKSGIGRALFELVSDAHSHNLSAEALLRAETRRREKAWRRKERRKK